ncbi:hypothetical protein AX16_003369 [Volvariella volvacea WC 439]|nr:hypothetical protein AX16_003369 [Volvariella volvacea WC 439]
MKSHLFSFGILASVASGVYGWGASGHQAVGYIAMQFLAPNALSFVRSSLGSTYNQSLGPAATWADEIKSNSAYSWASVLHYVDAEDSPPSTCNVDQSRDCADGKCILTAIANYTARVVDTTLSSSQRQEALKFLDHFIGDIGQPLHVEAIQKGGNGISVKCNGGTSNLHSVWDSGLVNRILSTSYSNSVVNWANTLSARIQTGSYRSQAASWISCSSPTPGCTLVWAQESNAIDCSLVFEYTTGQDLCTSSYFTAATPVIEAQIAKQGYRLAAWLNVLFDGAPLLP